MYAVKEAVIFAPRPRVLVAEDQDDVIAALRLLLKNNGYEVDFVKSPGEALRAISTGVFDAVLLDLNYSRDTTSGAEGIELLSRVQALDDTLAVVAMTAWASIDLAVDAMHHGACDFVQKPWDNAQLLRVLEKQMQRSRDLRRRRMDAQLEQQEAADVQRALLPGEIAAPEGLAIVASSQSAKTVGGDYYDVIRLDRSRTAICIGDVVGKGIGAALLMSNLQAAVRTLASEIEAPGSFCDRVNKIVCANNVRGKFITFFYCVVDCEQKRMAYTNAGHNWPILVHSDGTCERLHTDDVVLGAVPDGSWGQNEVELRSGDRLVLFTDGISECAGLDGLEYGEDLLQTFVCENARLSAGGLKDRILESIGDHCNHAFSDDATLIVVAVE